MDPGTIVGLALAGLGPTVLAGVIVWLALQSRDDRVASAKLDARVQALTLENGNVVRQLGTEAAGRVDDQHRYEGVIAGLNAEVTRLQGELDAEIEPTAVHNRLAHSGLLGGVETGTTVADRPVVAASLPPRPATGVGPGPGGPVGGG